MMMGNTVNSDENIRLTAWLKTQRIENGYTMRSLATVLGISHTFIGKIENQKRRLDVIEYIWYCKALKVDPGEGLEVAQQGQEL